MCKSPHPLQTANADPFGIKSKGIETDDPAASDNENGNSLVDLSDEELTMAQFALLSDEEMEEAFSEVVDIMLGDDDPAMVAAVIEITDALNSSDGSDDESTPLMESIAMSTEKKIAEATGIAIGMIGSDNESTPLMESMAMSNEDKIAEATGIALDMISKDGLINLAKEDDNVKAKDEL